VKLSDEVGRAKLEAVIPRVFKPGLFNETVGWDSQLYKGEVVMAEEEIGHVSHYFDHISVAAVEITGGTVEVGDTLHFKGNTTDFETKVDSMQIEHESVQKVKAGDSIGIKVAEKVRIHDKVFKVIGD